MTHQVTIDEAQAQLPGLVEAVKRGETVVIEQDNKPVVQLIAIAPTHRHARFGSAAGLVFVADDFDATMTDLDEYMQ